MCSSNDPEEKLRWKSHLQNLLRVEDDLCSAIACASDLTYLPANSWKICTTDFKFHLHRHRWAFCMYDQDNSGAISPEEMVEIFTLMYSVQVGGVPAGKKHRYLFQKSYNLDVPKSMIWQDVLHWMLFAGQLRGGRSGASQKGCPVISGYLLVLRIYKYLLVLTNTCPGFCGARCGQGRQNWIGGIHYGGRRTTEMIKQASNKGMTHCTKITELHGLEGEEGFFFNTDVHITPQDNHY